jgi:hypothetical protein
MSEVLLGAIIGAVGAILGGAAGSFILITREQSREAANKKRASEAATLLVWDELKANKAILKIAVDTQSVPDALSSQTYNDNQMTLAQDLDDHDALNAVREAYVHARAPVAFERRLIDDMTGMVVGRSPNPVVNDALAKTERAYEALRKHIPKWATEV